MPVNTIPEAVNAPYQVSGTTFVDHRTYNFIPQLPNVALTGGVQATVTIFTPLGVNGTDSNHYLYILDGGNSEAVLITGGTAVSGGFSGTIVFTPANSHAAGAWSIQSATAGIQEAVFANPGGAIWIAPGTWQIYAPTYIPVNTPATRIRGAGLNTTTLNVATTFTTSSTQGVFTAQPTTAPQTGPEISGFRLQFTQPNSSNRATYSNWTAFYMVNVRKFYLHELTISEAWNGINSVGTNGDSGSLSVIDNLYMTCFNRGIMLDQSIDIVKMSRISMGPMDIANVANKFAVYINPLNIGIETNNCQHSVQISNCSLASPYALHMMSTGSQAAPVQIIDSFFFAQGFLKIEQGVLQVTNSYFLVATDNGIYNNLVPAIQLTQGHIDFDGCSFTFFSNGGTDVLPSYISVNFIAQAIGQNLNALSMSGGFVDGAFSDITMILGNAQTGIAGTVAIDSVLFLKTSGGSTNTINIDPTVGGGDINTTIVNCTGYVSGGGATPGIKIGKDGSNSRNYIKDNNFSQFTQNFPASKVFGVYEDPNGTGPQQYDKYIKAFTGSVPTVSSANTITPNTGYFFLSGTTTIKTITPALPGSAQVRLYIIPTGAVPWDNTGNIATSAGTMTVNKMISAFFETVTGKWYFSGF